MDSPGSGGEAVAEDLGWREVALTAAVRWLGFFWLAIALWVIGLAIVDQSGASVALVVVVLSAVWTLIVASIPDASSGLRVATLFLPFYVTGAVSLLTVGYLPGPTVALALSVSVTALFVSWRWVLVTLATVTLPFALGAYRAERGWIPDVRDLDLHVHSFAGWSRSAVTLFAVFVLVALVIDRIVRELEDARIRQATDIGRLREEAEARARADAAAREAEQELISVHRMDLLGKLALAVSHDYNNQLMVILGWADLLGGRRGASPEQVERGLRAVSAASEEGRRVTGQLLAMSPTREGQGPPETDVGSALERQLPMLRHLFPEDTFVELSAEPALVATISAADLAQLTLSLALSARRSLKLGNGLRVVARSLVEMAGAADEAPEVEIRFGRVRVASSGAPPDLGARRSDDPSSALESAIAIAERSGGRVRFELAEGEDWSAVVRLPAPPSTTEAP